MHSAAEESDTWQDLPEFDAGLEDPQSDEPLEVSLEIDVLDEVDALDRDDSNAQDLDVGVELDLTPDAAQDAGGHDLVLDIGQLLDAGDERAADPADEGAGPVGFDATTDVPALDEQTAAPDEDLDSEVEDDGLDEELPGIDADEEGDFGEDASSLWSSSEFVADETLPAWVAQRWMVRDEHFHVGPLAAVTCVRGTVIAGGRELLWCREDQSARASVDGGSVVSMALDDRAADSILYATAVGRLMRRATSGAAEAVDGWRSCAALPASRAVVLELSQPGARAPSTVLMRTSTGQLLCTQDFGVSFFALPTPGRVLALSSSSDAPWVLVESTSEPLLAEVDLGSRSLRPTPLDRAARMVARGEAPRLCAIGSFVAIADETRGVAVSYDGGRHFELVPGTSNASAWAAGVHGDSPLLWLSVLEESTSRSWILRVTRGAAERIAELRIPAANAAKDMEESSDNVRISALCWQAERELLWAVGGFGIVSWCLPKDEKT